MNGKIFLIASLAVFVSSCQLFKGIDKNKDQISDGKKAADTLPAPNIAPELPIYRASNRRVNNLVHTKLDLRFDWQLARVLGTAYLDLRPHFYPTDSLTIDAKGFDLHKVELVEGEKTFVLDHTYNAQQIKIRLPREYTAKETYRIYIEYTAKPNQLAEGGSAAITSDKGLYFINHDGADPKLPKQIWTQGETEASSCWFPTIDSPNQRMTQEIYITVEDKYKTLSNGAMVFSIENGDGTRTDYWKQSLGHAPYLAMIAVGEFAVVKDRWMKKDSSFIDTYYYVDHDYEQYAKDIFGNSQEMLTFYSNILGFEYPWEKFHQVVVKEFVSGAMENTTAVVHGDFLHQTKREMLDGDFEGVIAHELFHHWFGDLITCESWSNLPLNESFATYGEYLWLEFKYGREYADHESERSMRGYLSSAERKTHNLIWFDYNERDDMFDSHSYNKGGRILHMLRKYLGDEAFFAGLKQYIETYKYKAVEVHDLRRTFEDLTGQDLNWFFNQWFHSKGHPDLKISHRYKPETKTLSVQLEQVQDFSKNPLFILPLEVDIYTGDTIVRKSILMDKASQEFTFEIEKKPMLVIVDAERMMVGTRQEEKSTQEYVFQYYNTKLYANKVDAIKQFSAVAGKDSLAAEALIDALKDDFVFVRTQALNEINVLMPKHQARLKPLLVSMANTDREANVRRAALDALYENFRKDSTLIPVYNKAINDSSYDVISSALEAIASYDTVRAMKIAGDLEKEDTRALRGSIASLYGRYGGENQYEFMSGAIKESSGFSKFGVLRAFNEYSVRQNEDVINKSLKLYEEVAGESKSSWIRITAIQGLLALDRLYMQRKEEAENNIVEAELNQEREEMIVEFRKDLNLAIAQREKIEAIKGSLGEKETDETVLRFLGK